MGREKEPLAGRRRALPRVATLAEHELLTRPAFRKALDEAAAGEGRDPEDAAAYAARCLKEMAARPDERNLRLFEALARFISTRSYHPELDVNSDRLTELTRLAESHPLVFLWSHKSHLDGFVFMRSLYEHDFRPQPLSFAGINMAFPLFGPLMRRAGAIFLRRSFRDDAIYKLVLRHYIDYLVAKRLPLSWSIEGTRSRTGKLNPPKLGLIQWVVEAYHRSACDDALLIPVSISFDQIAEIDDYVAMQRGLPKRKESLTWFIGYITGMQAAYGRIFVRYAEPIPLSQNLSVPEALLDGATDEQMQVRKLAFEVCSRIEQATPINATDLVTLVLLGANGRALTPAEIRRTTGEIIELIEERDLPMAGDLGRETDTGLDANLAMLARTGLLQCHGQGPDSIFSIAPGKALAAAYYRNTIVHYFLAAAIAEVALAGLAAPARRADAGEAMLALRDLLKFEFFFRRKPEFLDAGLGYLDGRLPGWDSESAEPADVFATTAPLFGHSILRSFLECHHVLAACLTHAGGAPIRDRDALIGDCLTLGERMLLRKQIGSETAISKPLFENAVRLADHRRLLTGKEELGEARAAFAAETRRGLRAIGRLQRAFDEALSTADEENALHAARPRGAGAVQ